MFMATTRTAPRSIARRKLKWMRLAASIPFAMPITVSAQQQTDSPPANILPKLIANLRGSMKDPDSIRDMRVCAPEKGEDGWSVKFSMNAKNSYGGYTGAAYFVATFVNGNVLDVGSPDLGPVLNAKLLSMTAECSAVPDAEIHRLLKR